MTKINSSHNLRSRFHSDEPSVLTDDATTDTDLLDLISQLQQVNFADDRRAKQRVRQSVVRRIESQSAWQRLRLLSSGWGQRVVLATVSLMLFATLNLVGLFGLPQHTQHVLDQPVIAARSLVIPVLTMTLPLNTADFFQPATQSLIPLIGMSTTTPIRRSVPLAPTPMPVPAPNQ